MGADEEGTLERLKALRGDLVDPEIAEHKGRIVKTTGDGLLVEFASVVDAVRCAVSVQQAMPERNADVAADNRIELRIGINLGDVIVESDDDLYGDGVNIAARLQELAEPGGILISGPVYDQVHNKLSIGFDCLGQQSLKNVANPVTGYRVLQGGAGTRPVASRPGRQERAAPQPPARSAQGGLSRAWEWYVGLPRLSAVMITLAVFMFLINLFSGLSHIWFQWPATVFLLIAFLRAASSSKRS